MFYKRCNIVKIFWIRREREREKKEEKVWTFVRQIWLIAKQRNERNQYSSRVDNERGPIARYKKFHYERLQVEVDGYFRVFNALINFTVSYKYRLYFNPNRPQRSKSIALWIFVSTTTSLACSTFSQEAKDSSMRKIFPCFPCFIAWNVIT